MAFKNLREAGIKSFAFFIYGYPGDTPESMEQNTRFAIELDADFANFYPAVPYPGTALYEKARRDGLGSRPTTGRRWSTWYYVLQGDGLDEQVVMAALSRAQAALLPAPVLHRRHLGDIVRMLLTSQALVWKIVTRMLSSAEPDVLGPSSRGRREPALQTWRGPSPALRSASAAGRSYSAGAGWPRPPTATVPRPRGPDGHELPHERSRNCTK